jgi:three-Cys-motif partner protein
MADTLPTVWAAEPHTLAKHGILKTYLQAWAAILAQSPYTKARELLFVDGFAGPGEYKGGEAGSPIVALDALAHHSRPLPIPVRLRFIESDAERWAHLSQRLKAREALIAQSKNIRVDPPILGDCETDIRALIAARDGARQSLGPALFFLDQFGYSQVPMELIRSVMKHEKCEVFLYMNFLRLNQFLSDQSKWPGITAAFGDDRWKQALHTSGQKTETVLRESYIAAMRENGATDYAWPFAMFDSSGRLIHWLIFGTNNLKGLEQMKASMRKADKSGTYRFSDREDPGQQTFLSGFDDDWLADELAQHFQGKTLNEHQVWEFVLTHTPCHLYKTAVNKLRKQGRIVPPTRTWPIRFN